MNLICTNGVKSLLTELLPEFERVQGVKVAVAWGATAALMKAIEAGGRCDLTILTAEAIDELVKRGTVVSGSRVDIARSSIGLAVRRGASKPDISTPDALKHVLLGAESVAHSRSGMSGLHFPTVLQRLGIAETLRGRIVIPDPPEPIGNVVARGDAEIGVQQISELLPVAGIEILGPLPGDLQRVTTFSAGLMTAAKDAETAKALVAFVAAKSPPLLKQKGLEPAD
jgi:molybdate transport system substrate-binding protein